MVTILTIGHSRHPLEEFIEILSANGVELLIDVRTVHGSRHNPQFGGSHWPPACQRTSQRSPSTECGATKVSKLCRLHANHAIHRSCGGID